MRISYVIIERDVKTAIRIHDILDEQGDFLFLGSFVEAEKAIPTLLENKPDIIFLGLPAALDSNQTAWFLTAELRRNQIPIPKIVVLSETQEFAYQAIKEGVVDYLLKPVDTTELLKFISKLQLKVEFTSNTLFLKSYGDYRFIKIADLLYAKADNNSTDLYLTSGEKIAAFKTLKHFERTLPPQFVRIHNSYIVNAQYITRIHIANNICYLKGSKLQLPVSKSYKNNLDRLVEIILSL
ncbi:LytTR family DNA-binding domain-containing protein [Flavobacterium sp.]|uniref:LytR/AlgR family response regulator transcription factor n=1 Tax=Flavobacterium sp. TaxID=239 RepID=UPI002635C762|nr:LytTR family DNA-binding domain-containing protein [Flavobacterium sp.]